MDFLSYLEAVGRSLPGLLVVLLYVALLWRVFDGLSKFDDTAELFHKNNTAYLLQRLSLSAAQVIAMLVVIPDYDPAHPWESLGYLLLEGAYVALALFASRFFVDWVILRRVNNEQLLLKGNLAVGIAEAGAYLGIGLLLAASLTGTADTLWVSILSTAAFFGLGLLVVWGIYWLIELATRYNLQTSLEQGKVAAGLELAGAFVGISLSVRTGVAGDFDGWLVGLQWFFLTVIVAVVVQVGIYALLSLFMRKVWKIPKPEQGAVPTTTVAGLRAGAFILVGLLASSLITQV